MLASVFGTAANADYQCGHHFHHFFGGCMKGFASLVLAFVAATAIAGAQDVRKSQGDVAFLFAYNGLGSSTVGAYNGGVGGQFYLADDMALRVGLGFGTTSTESGADGSKTTISGTAISISPGVRMNIASNSNVVGYVGGQVMFGMNSVGSEREGSNASTTNSASSLGVGLFFGAEWFPTKNISLGMEYGLGFMSGSSSTTIKDNAGAETKSDGPSTSGIYLGTPASLVGTNNAIAIGSVAITAAFYFN